MAERPGPDRPRPEVSYTFLVVPDGGRRQPLQHTLSARSLRRVILAASGALGLLVVAALVQVATFSRVREHDGLVRENVALKAEVDSMRRELAELAPVIQRVRAYDEQLRGLAASGSLPGFVDGAAPLSRDLIYADLAAIDFESLDENLARLQRASEAMPQLWPVEGQVTSGFGWRRDPFGRARWKFHGGLDIGTEYGTPILATGAGTVVFSDWHSGHGRMVELDHGGGIATRYCHASQLLVSEGEEVLAGQTVALVGSSGMSTGPHLHYELVVDGERVDPRPYLPTDGP
jgi:murein DD-endopeptidase MepM/ murein hydrolase activator NlpD